LCCGTRKSVVGTDLRLHCTQCGKDRGGLGPRTRNFILAIAGKFGAPEVITIRAPLGNVESLDLISAADTGQLLDNWRIRRRQFGSR
jgi:hypothetical protein